METTLNVFTVGALLLQFGVIIGQQFRINRVQETVTTMDAYLLIMMRLNHLSHPTLDDMRRITQERMRELDI